MSTLSVATEIKLKAPTWGYDGNNSILQMMDRAQRAMFSKLCRNTIYLDPTTGDHPLLSTTAGVFSYIIPSVNVLLNGIQTSVRIADVKRVFIAPKKCGAEYRGLIMARGMFTGFNNNVEFTCVPCLSTGGDGTTVLFPFDPQTSTDKYQYVAMLEPLRLTGTGVPLMVPEIWEPAIIDGALGYIEYYNYGRSDRLQTFTDTWCSDFWEVGRNSGYRGVTLSTPVRVI